MPKLRLLPQDFWTRRQRLRLMPAPFCSSLRLAGAAPPRTLAEQFWHRPLRETNSSPEVTTGASPQPRLRENCARSQTRRSSGKTVRARDPAGRIRSFSAPSSVRGLAFMPKGYRLAIAHYGGASLWFPNATVLPDRFEWKGSHLSISVSPDGRFLVTAMQE